MEHASEFSKLGCTPKYSVLGQGRSKWKSDSSVIFRGGLSRHLQNADKDTYKTFSQYRDQRSDPGNGLTNLGNRHGKSCFFFDQRSRPILL